MGVFSVLVEAPATNSEPDGTSRPGRLEVVVHPGCGVVVVVSPAAGSVRRALAPVAWSLLEELLCGSRPTDADAATRSCDTSVRDLAVRLGLDKDTVGRAVDRLRVAGIVTRTQSRIALGSFGRSSYLIRIPDGLAVIDDQHTCVAVTASSASRRRSRSVDSSPASQLSFLEV